MYSVVAFIMLGPHPSPLSDTRLRASVANAAPAMAMADLTVASCRLCSLAATRTTPDKRQGGAIALAQNEASSVVFGMPGEAIRLGAARHLLSIDEIAPTLVALVGNLKLGRAL